MEGLYEYRILLSSLRFSLIMRLSSAEFRAAVYVGEG